MRRGTIQIRNVLDSLAVYDTSKPFLDAETGAYEAGIGLLLEELERVYADLFVATATQEGLRRREVVFRPWGARTEMESLRSQLAERERMRACLAGELENRLAACGIEGEIQENHEGGILLRVSALQGLEEAEALAEMRALLPAHLPLHWEGQVKN